MTITRGQNQKRFAGERRAEFRRPPEKGRRNGVRQADFVLRFLIAGMA